MSSLEEGGGVPRGRYTFPCLPHTSPQNNPQNPFNLFVRVDREREREREKEKDRVSAIPFYQMYPPSSASPSSSSSSSSASSPFSSVSFSSSSSQPTPLPKSPEYPTTSSGRGREGVTEGSWVQSYLIIVRGKSGTECWLTASSTAYLSGRGLDWHARPTNHGPYAVKTTHGCKDKNKPDSPASCQRSTFLWVTMLTANKNGVLSFDFEA